jgi:hypothetical protein
LVILCRKYAGWCANDSAAADGQASGWNAFTSENIVPDADYVAKFNRSAMRPGNVAFPERKASRADELGLSLPGDLTPLLLCAGAVWRVV